jgi:chromosome segregation ATPase
MENNKFKKILIATIIIAVIWLYRNYSEIDRLKGEVSRLSDEVEYLEDDLTNCNEHLSNCDDALSQANMNIEDAQSMAWESYDDMGEALENLETVEY